MLEFQEFGCLKLIKVCMHVYKIFHLTMHVIYTGSPNMAPRNFTALVIAATSVTFQWNILSNQQANGIVVRQYVIICSERNSNIRVSRM